MSVTKLKSKWKSGKLHFYGAGKTDDAIGTDYGVNYGLTDSGALLHGAGTSASRVVVNSANKKFLSYYVENEATSGDNRGMYLRLYMSGAGGGGEAARIFTTVDNVAAGTAHGAHVSLSLGTTGSVTGQGIGLRCTLHVPTTPLVAGTYAGGQSELYFDGATSDISGTTTHSIHRFVMSGNAAGIATATHVFEFADMSASQFQASTDETKYAKSLRCDINGTDYYLMFASTAA